MPKKRARSEVDADKDDKDDDKTNVTDLLDCPVCMTCMLPPIFQCTAGHLICKDCSGKLPSPKRCPSCRVDMSNKIRALGVEHLAATMRFPCAYSDSGCEERVAYACKQEHEANCEHRPIKCLYRSCSWTGHKAAFVKHTADSHKHKIYTQYNGCQLIFRKSETKGRRIEMARCSGSPFWFVAEVREDRFMYVAVFSLEAEGDSDKLFSFDIDIFTSNGGIRWAGFPISLHKNRTFDAEPCCRVPVSALVLGGVDRRTNIHVRVNDRPLTGSSEKR